MHAGNSLITGRTNCPRCDAPATDRLNYFTGQFLAERDFRAEQDYHVGKHRNHNRHLHGWGTVCGLKVVPHPNEACPDRIVIEPGLAVDCCGREIVVDEEICVDLARYVTDEQLAAGGTVINHGPNETTRINILAVSICYRECGGERVPALYSECGCGDDGGLHASRIHETFGVKVELIDLNHPPDWLKQIRPSGGAMKWSSTLNVDGAIRAAASPDGQHLYVITDAEQGVLHVFETANGCLHETRPVTDAQGVALTAVDLALSPNGDTVYVLCRPAGTNAATVRHGVLAFATAALADAPITIAVGDAAISDRSAMTCDASGTIFVLLPGGPDDQRFFVAAPGAVQATAKATGTRKLAAMAASPSGRFAFLAVQADAKLLVYDRAAGTFTDAAIDLPADVLAVASDETTLLTAAGGDVGIYTIDAAGKPATPGKKVSLGGGDTIAALGISNGWAYAVTADAGGSHGSIRSINLADPAAVDAVSDAIAVVADPRQVLIADGTNLYVVGHGVAEQGCGGVSVVEASDHDCSKILWRQLEGCPPCDTECVPLALITQWRPGKAVTGPQIRNEYRPLLPSTNTLRDLILCCCGHHETAAPEPPVEPPTPAPDLKLTRLVKLSWEHNKKANKPISVANLPSVLREREMTQGLVIGFDGEIKIDDPLPNDSIAGLDAEHVFRVQVRPPGFEKDASTLFGFPLLLWVPLAAGPTGKPPAVIVVPVVWALDNGALKATYADMAAQPKPQPNGLAYLFVRELLTNVMRSAEVSVAVRGDFIRDINGIPVDVDFPRFAMQGTANDDVQPARSGGVFESWLSFRPAT